MIEQGKRIRIIMTRAFEDEPPTIFRGELNGASEVMLEIIGRRYTKIFDTATDRAEERPLDQTDKTYAIPMASIRFVETIESGSREEELDQKIRSEKMIFRKGALATVD